jgi:hypothetical protein
MLQTDQEYPSLRLNLAQYAVALSAASDSE